MSDIFTLMPFDKMRFALIVKGDRNGTAFCRCVAANGDITLVGWITGAPYEPTATQPGTSWPAFFVGEFTAGNGRIMNVGDWRNANYAQNVGGGATASFTQAAGTVRDVVATSGPHAGGYGYPGNVEVAFSGGGGAGASAYGVVMGGRIVDYVIRSTGSGYTSNPACTVINPNVGKLLSAKLAENGSGYTVPPAVVITDPGGGTGAEAVAILVDGKVVRIDFINGGSGYTNATEIELSGDTEGVSAIAYFALDDFGTTGSCAAILSRGFATLAVSFGGADYTDTPEVNFINVNAAGHTGGTGAAATATIAAGAVNSLTLDNAGSGYPTLESFPASVNGKVTILGGKFNVSVVPEATDNTVTTTYKFRRLGAPVPMTIRWDIRNKVTNAVVSTQSLTITAADVDNYSADYTMTGIVGAAYILTNFRIEVPL